MKRFAAFAVMLAAAVSLCSCWRLYNYEEKREYGPTVEYISYSERFILNPEKNAALPTTFNVKKPDETDKVPAYRRSDYSGDSEYALEAAKQLPDKDGDYYSLDLFRRYGDTEAFIYSCRDSSNAVTLYAVTVKDGAARLAGSLPGTGWMGDRLFAHAYENGKLYIMASVDGNRWPLGILDTEKNSFETKYVTVRGLITDDAVFDDPETEYYDSSITNITVKNGKVYFISPSVASNFSPVLEFDPDTGITKTVFTVSNAVKTIIEATEDGFVGFVEYQVSEGEKVEDEPHLVFFNDSFETLRDVKLNTQEFAFRSDEQILTCGGKVYITTNYGGSVVYDTEKNTEKAIDCTYASSDERAIVEKRGGKIRHLS